MSDEPLSRAIDILGSQSALARICGVSQPSVWAWVRAGKPVPAEHVIKVEVATGISRHELRPDIYPVADHAEATTALANSPSCGKSADVAAQERAA